MPDGRWTRTYDPLDRVETVEQATSGTLTFSYNTGGLRDLLIDTENGRTTYAYDAAGRMKSLVNPDDDRTSYSYDAAGRRTVKELANDTRASYTYDDANRVTLLGNLKSDSTVISSFDYEYDAVGNRTRVVEADGDRVTWTYDPTYQLLAEHRDGVDAYAHTFSYDPVGNRLTEDDDTTVTTSVYDVANRLTYSETPSGRTTYTFDADGNQRSIEIPAGDVTTQTWSYENKLIQIEQPLDEVATYTYALVKRDNTEQRVTKDDDVDLVRFVWDDDRIITQLDDLGTVEAEYTLEPAAFGNLLSQKRDADSSCYHYDALGSTRDLTDTAEVATDEYSYYAFGKPATTSGSTENPYQWVGELGYYYDAESGYDTLRARPYNTNTGRFLSEDPIAADEENLYRYVGNNTVNETDPSGLDLFSGEITRLRELIKGKESRLADLCSRREEQRRRGRPTNRLDSEIRAVERQLRNFETQLATLLEEVPIEGIFADDPEDEPITVPITPEPQPAADACPVPQAEGPDNVECTKTDRCLVGVISEGIGTVAVRGNAGGILGALEGKCGKYIATIHYDPNDDIERAKACLQARKIRKLATLNDVSDMIGKGADIAETGILLVLPGGQIVEFAKVLAEKKLTAKELLIGGAIVLLAGAAARRWWKSRKVPKKPGNLGLKDIIKKASGWTPAQAGSFFGWVGRRVTKGPADFTRAQLVKNGFTKKVLENMAKAYEAIAKLESRNKIFNPSAASRAKQLREIVDALF